MYFQRHLNFINQQVPVDRLTRVAPVAEVVAQSANLAARNREALIRIEEARKCQCAPKLAKQRAALAEAKRLVKRAEVAPSSEQPRFERRAGELLRELRGY